MASRSICESGIPKSDGTNASVPAIPDHDLVDTPGDYADFFTIGRPFPGSYYDFTPRVAWSPDSSWLIFSAARGIQIVHPDGTGWRRLTSGTDPDWTR